MESVSDPFKIGTVLLDLSDDSSLEEALGCDSYILSYLRDNPYSAYLDVEDEPDRTILSYFYQNEKE